MLARGGLFGKIHFTAILRESDELNEQEIIQQQNMCTG